MISWKVALAEAVAPAAMAEKRWVERATAVTAPPVVTGSPGREEREETVPLAEPVPILAEPVVTALMAPPSVATVLVVAVAAVVTVAVAAEPPSLVVLAVALVGPVSQEQRSSAMNGHEMGEMALPEAMGQ